MNSLPPNRWSPADFAELEELIAGAGNWVVPSEDLRPRVMEAARELDGRQIQLRKLRNFGVCVAGLWLAVGLLLLFFRDQRREVTAPSSAEVEMMSVQYAQEHGYSVDWGMVDVFRQLRGGDYRDASTSPGLLTPSPSPSPPPPSAASKIQ